MVAIQIIQHGLIPCQRLFPWEMALNDRASTPLDLFTLRCRDGAGLDIRVRQRRPDGIALRFERIDFRHACGNHLAEPVKNALHITELRPQRLLHLPDRRFMIGR